METYKELKDAIKANKKLVWNDPEPMADADYLIDEVFKLDDIEAYLNDMDDDEVEDLRGWPILIHYGGGSEAEVELSEIGFAKEIEDLDYWLENISVMSCDDMIDNFKKGDRLYNLNELLSGWFSVVNTDGIIAYFAIEKDAFRFRLDYINNKLNS